MSTSIKFQLSKTVNGKREALGTMDIFCPTLKDFGVDIEPTAKDEATGELTYATDAANWLYSSIVQAVKAAARNKFMPQTDTLRPGASVAANLAELVAPATGNKGAALVERRQLLDSFRAWLASTGKNEAVQKLLTGMLDKTDNLLMQDAGKREKIKGYFTAFGEANVDSLTAWQINYLSSAVEACDQEQIDF